MNNFYMNIYLSVSGGLVYARMHPDSWPAQVNYISLFKLHVMFNSFINHMKMISDQDIPFVNIFRSNAVDN